MKTFNSITGRELQDKELGDIPFVVDKLLPTGLSLLAGAPKVGKSWLALWLSVQVARGETIWDLEVQGGTVLYLCYEDNELRIQNRLLELTDEAPSTVHFCTEISRLGGELETRLRNFMYEHGDTRLIIIDTLQTIRPPNTESSYASDYTDMLTLKNIAYEHQVAILLIHHFRKAKDSDVFHQISGSTGLQGVVDTMFTLTQSKRGERVAVLSCIGRDIEPREMELERSEENVWIKISDSLSEMTIKDLEFINAVKLFMADKEHYIGTATELSSLLRIHSADNFSNKVIAKNIRNLAKRLESLAIIGVSRRSNGTRLIELTRKSDDSADEIQGGNITDPIGTEMKNGGEQT